MKTSALLLIPILLGLTACASGPRYDSQTANMELTAAQVIAKPEDYLDTQIIWGGIIINTRNLPDHTEIELLAYPLDGRQQPMSGKGEQGRFLAKYNRYLETVDYAPGRQLTVRGHIAETINGKVGDAPYTYPVIQANDIYLWPRTDGTAKTPQVHFGIGIIFGR